MRKIIEKCVLKLLQFLEKAFSVPILFNKNYKYKSFIKYQERYTQQSLFLIKLCLLFIGLLQGVICLTIKLAFGNFEKYLEHFIKIGFALLMIAFLTIIEKKLAHNKRQLSYLISITIIITLIFNQIFSINTILTFYDKQTNTPPYYLYNNLYNYWIMQFILLFSWIKIKSVYKIAFFLLLWAGAIIFILGEETELSSQLHFGISETFLPILFIVGLLTYDQSSVDNYLNYKQINKERKKWEKIINSLQVGVLIINENTMLIEYMNKFLKKLINYNPTELYLTQIDYKIGKLSQLNENESNFLLSEAIAQIMQIKQQKIQKKVSLQFYKTFKLPDYFEESHQILKQDIEKEFEVRISELFNEKIIIYFHDITDYVANQILTNNSTFQQKILESFSHEIKTPLNGAITPLQQSIYDYQEKQQIDLQNLISSLRCIQILDIVLNDIIDFTSILSRKFNLNYSCTNFQQYINSLVEVIQDLVEIKNLKFSCYRAKALPVMFITDFQRLSQILINLIQNAIKFTENGEIKLTIQSPQQNLIKFQVIDTGIGMSQAKHQQILNLLNNADLQSNLNINSTGICLGLSISQLLAQQLGPQGIQVKSEKNVGSEFQFFIQAQSCEGIVSPFLPLFENNELKKSALMTKAHTKSFSQLKIYSQRLENQQNEEDKQQQQSFDQILTMSDLSECSQIENVKECKILTASKYKFTKKQDLFFETKPTRVLIVDDDGFNLNALQLLLTKKFNVKISQAHNGKQALQAVTNQYFDIILMDYQMPIMDGTEATKAIRKYFSHNDLPQIPIIACSAFGSTENINECLQSGMNAYIKKPITYEQLKNVFSKYLI